jgi:hypothetical protein
MGYCHSYEQRLQYRGVYMDGTDKKNLYYKTPHCPHMNDPVPPTVYTKYSVLVSLPDGKYCKDCNFITEQNDCMICALTTNGLNSVRTERKVQVTKDISDTIIRYEYVKDKTCPNSRP